MMNYKMETIVEANCGIKRNVRSYRTFESAKKNMKKWVNELDARKADGHLDTYCVYLIHDNKEIGKVEA